MSKHPDPAAAKLGRKGGRKKSAKKKAASRRSLEYARAVFHSKRLGITPAEYLKQRSNGKRLCSDCKKWKDKSQMHTFDRPEKRPICKACKAKKQV